MNPASGDILRTQTGRIPLADGRGLSLEQTLVVGVLNVTPDSFSDGGRHVAPEPAVEHALKMEEQGADIIDIGGESTRPGSAPVPEDVEKARVLPVIQRLRDLTDIPISIDTYKAGTAEAALKAGANMVNDISALSFDTRMPGVVKEYGPPVVLMHMQGTPKEMQVAPHYEDCVAEVMTFLQRRIERCLRSGIEKDKIIIDPGIGFGKRLQDNLQILARFREFLQLQVPVMVGASRKSFIGNIHPVDSPAEERLGGSLAAALVAVLAGAAIVRCHDVRPTVEALRVLDAIRNAT